MFPKETIIGILISKSRLEIRIAKDEKYKIGYSTIPRVTIRANKKFLKDFQRSLYQHQIESKYLDEEGHSRPKPVLYINGAHAKKLVRLVPEEYSDAHEQWPDFRTILDMLDRKEHLTLEGLETIMKMRGLL